MILVHSNRGISLVRRSLLIGHDLLIFLVIGLKRRSADAVIGVAVKAKID